MHTPILKTERLLLRPFTENDLNAILDIYGDAEVNRFLPWFPLQNTEEARRFYETRLAGQEGLHYAVCLQQEDRPIGYVDVSAEDSADLGYGLRREYWRRGIITEACRAVLDQLQKDGVPYVTATHDVENPRSGRVMQKLGMRYQYSYEERWQPKNRLVTFRLYQLNLDGQEDRVYRKYWEQSAVHYVETEL